MTEQQALENLDAIDREIARFDAEIAGATDKVTRGEAQRADAEAKLSAATAALEANRAEERAIQRRIDDLKNARRAAMRVLETGVGDAEAAQRQLDRCDGLIDEAETAMLELLERQDRVKLDLTAAETAARAARAGATETNAASPEIVARATAARTARAADRVGALAALPAELRSRYEAFRGRGRYAVARIRDNACEACAMAVQPQMSADLKRGRLVSCHGCHRWLALPGHS